MKRHVPVMGRGCTCRAILSTMKEPQTCVTFDHNNDYSSKYEITK